MDKTEFFFVYGTLKVGGHFAKAFDSHRVNSQIAILKGFDLFDLGWFPGILLGDGEVVGEVHEYNRVDYVTTRMDGIEGYNPEYKDGMYLRKRFPVITEAGEEIEANVYVFNGSVPAQAKKIENGTWEAENIRT